MKHIYLARITFLEPIEDKDPHDLARRLSSGLRWSGLRVDHAEMFNERDFVNDVWKASWLNEIDLDVLFQDILHISEEEVDRYLFDGVHE